MIDWRVITDDFEGGIRTTAYVPVKNGKVIGKSGVTIGGGVDLGSRTPESLRNLGVPPELVELLAPYMGMQGDGAWRWVQAHPLRISLAHARLITELVKASVVAEVRAAYEKASEKCWDDLPDRAQTVIASLAFNFGSQLWVEMHTTWSFVVSNNWSGLSRWLRQFPGKNPELDLRRKKEGIYLMPLYVSEHDPTFRKKV